MLGTVSGFQVGVEERDDPLPSVTGRGLVTLGRCQLRERLDPERQLRGVVIVEEAVAGLGIQPGVVIDPGRLQCWHEAIEGFAQAGPPVSAAVAGDDRAGLGQEALALPSEPPGSCLGRRG